MELRGGQAGWSDGQIIAPMAIHLGNWNCLAGGDCVLLLVKSAMFYFHVRPQLCALTHPSVSGTSEASPTLSLGS